MQILVLKLLLTPLLISAATLAGRRWGPTVNGLLVGLPMTTGPISFVLANQYGARFAAKVAAGNLAGQVSMCVFCLAYSLVGRRRPWAVSAVVAVAAWLVTTLALDRFVWLLLPAFGALMVSIAVALLIIPRQASARSAARPPWWDLPARIVVATTLVFVFTNFASALGAQLTGLLSTFPVYALIFASFTHLQQGAEATASLLRGTVLGLLAYSSFFLVVGLCLLPLGIAATYPMAVAAAVAVSGVSYVITRR